jgi:hypothetical protein
MWFNGFVKVYQLLKLLYDFIIAEQDAGLVTWAADCRKDASLFCYRLTSVLNSVTHFIKMFFLK